MVDCYDFIVLAESTRNQDKRLWERLCSRYVNKLLKTLVEKHVSGHFENDYVVGI